MQIIDGRKIRDGILATLQTRIASLPFMPLFCDVLVGDDSASAQYVVMKERVAKSIGIDTFEARFTHDISTEDLITEIKKIAKLPHMSGLIIQLPLPSHIETERVLNAVPLAIDVDATGALASKRVYENNPKFIFPTAAAILAVIDSLNMDMSDKNIVMIGRGILVGRPVSHALVQRGLNVTVIDHSTENSDEILATADVVISATGQAGLVHGEMLKKGVIVIDAGASESNGGISGDVNRESIEDVASVLSPVPGGVGPVTVAMLMNNVVIAAEQLAQKVV